MKGSILLLTLLAGVMQVSDLSGQVQFPIDSTTHRITYTGIVEVKDRTAQQLYQAAKVWFSTAFKSGEAVIDMDDNVGFKIIGKWVSEFTYKTMGIGQPGGLINFTITIACKEGRFKYTINNVVHSGFGNVPTFGPLEQEKWPKGTGDYWSLGNNLNRLKEQASMEALMAIKSLRSSMIASPEADQW